MHTLLNRYLESGKVVWGLLMGHQSHTVPVTNAETGEGKPLSFDVCKCKKL